MICITFIVLSLDPDAKNGPFKAAAEEPSFPLLLFIAVVSPVFVAAASLIAAVAVSGAQAIHSTTWSCSRKSALHSLVSVAQIFTDWSFEQVAIYSPVWPIRNVA